MTAATTELFKAYDYKDIPADMQNCPPTAIKLNIDDVMYKSKPKNAGAIRNRLCSADSIREVTPEQLLTAISQGCTFTPAVMTGTTSDTWQEQYVVCADIDNDTYDKNGNKILVNPTMTPERALDIMKQYEITPYAMYYSFHNKENYPKFRIVLILDTPLTDSAEATELIDRFTGIFNEPYRGQFYKKDKDKNWKPVHCADTTASDSARFYYGGKANCVFFNSGETTPLSKLRDLPVYVESEYKDSEPVSAENGDTKTAAHGFVTQYLPAAPHNSTVRPYEELLSTCKNDIEHFDLAAYIERTTNSKRHKSGETLYFNPCPYCGHKDDFSVTGAEWYCFHESGQIGGTIIDYLMHCEGLSKADAFEKFKFAIMGYDREEWKQSWIEYKKQHPDTTDDTQSDDTQSETEYTYQKLEKIGFSTKWRKQGGMLCYDGVKKCNRNIKIYIHFRDLLYDVRYNEFAGYAERLKGGKWGRISDYDLLQLITRIEKKAYTEGGDYADLKAISEWDIKKEFVADYILENAKRVNPVKEYFESLHWDGKKRISTLLHDVLGSDNNEYTAAATRLFLLGIISRIYAPGTKFDYMIILQGRQGYGKSAFLKALAVNEEWYASVGNEHMKDTKVLGETAAGKIILEYEELDGIRQTTAEKLKATITRADDQYRPAYSVLSEMHPRQYVFAGTTNNGQYLSDPTGNRRFLPIPITKKGFLTPNEVNQIWAEAYAIYQTGDFKLYLPAEIEEVAETYRGDATRLISDDFTETIERYLNCRAPGGQPKQVTTVKAIYQALCDDPLGKMNYKDAQKIILTALTTLKWENKQIKINGKNCRRYVRPTNNT